MVTAHSFGKVKAGKDYALCGGGAQHAGKRARGKPQDPSPSRRTGPALKAYQVFDTATPKVRGSV
jgi:hypothetical protein